MFNYLETLIEDICNMAILAGLNHFKDPKVLEQLQKKSDKSYKMGETLKIAEEKIKNATDIVLTCTKYLQTNARRIGSNGQVEANSEWGLLGSEVKRINSASSNNLAALV